MLGGLIFAWSRVYVSLFSFLNDWTLRTPLRLPEDPTIAAHHPQMADVAEQAQNQEES